MHPCDPRGEVILVPTVEYAPEQRRFVFSEFGKTFARIYTELVEARCAGQPATREVFGRVTKELAFAMSGDERTVYMSGTGAENTNLCVQFHMTEANTRRDGYTYLKTPFDLPNVETVCAIPIVIGEDEPVPTTLVHAWAAVLREYIYSTRPRLVIISNKKSIDLLESVVKYANTSLEKMIDIVQGVIDSGVETPAFKTFVTYAAPVIGRPVRFLRLCNTWWLKNNGTPEMISRQAGCIDAIWGRDGVGATQVVQLGQGLGSVRKTTQKFVQVQGARSVRAMFK